MNELLEIIVTIIIACNLVILFITYANQNYNAYRCEVLEDKIKKLEEELKLEHSRRRMCEKIIARGRINEK